MTNSYNEDIIDHHSIVEERIILLLLESSFIAWIKGKCDTNYLFKLKYFLLKLNINGCQLGRPSKLTYEQIYNYVLGLKEVVNFFKEFGDDIIRVTVYF